MRASKGCVLLFGSPEHAWDGSFQQGGCCGFFILSVSSEGFARWRDHLSRSWFRARHSLPEPVLGSALVSVAKKMTRGSATLRPHRKSALEAPPVSLGTLTLHVLRKDSLCSSAVPVSRPRFDPRVGGLSCAHLQGCSRPFPSALAKMHLDSATRRAID